MNIYHGSIAKIVIPEYGKGKLYKDYGPGFYCTEDIEMAKEWGCSEDYDGYANSYEIDLNNLKVLNLNDCNYTILHWLALLLQNRSFRISNPLAKDAKQYLLENYSIDTLPYDVIIGYRADDSYFSFAEDFLNNAISVTKLSKAMQLGNLGEQVVIMSKKAFKHLHFLDAAPAPRTKYYLLKAQRDKSARAEYLSSDRKPSYSADELYMLDIMRQGVKADDERLHF